MASFCTPECDKSKCLRDTKWPLKGVEARNEKRRGDGKKDKKVRQAICINNDVRNRTAIGKHRFTGSSTQKGFRIHQILRRRN